MGRLCRFILWCVLLVLSISAFGCNMMRGLGEDIQQAGGALKRACN